MNASPDLATWHSLMELDRAAGKVKGSAFRAFRHIESQWRESLDFRVLDHEQDRATITALRDNGRIYASTVNLVLLSPAMAQAILDQMRRMTTDPAE